DVVRVAGNVAPAHAGRLHAGGEHKQIGRVGGADVVEKILRVDRNRSREIGERGVEARAGERRGGLIAAVAIVVHDEGRKHRAPLAVFGVTWQSGDGLRHGGRRGGKDDENTHGGKSGSLGVHVGTWCEAGRGGQQSRAVDIARYVPSQRVARS